MVTILLVDDDPIVRNIGSLMLANLGFTVLNAGDGAEAVELFQSRQEEIALVLCDQIMPHMDGLQTLAALREIKPALPVILVSGIARDPETLPGPAFLKKPYSMAALRQAVGQALATAVPFGVQSEQLTIKNISAQPITPPVKSSHAHLDVSVLDSICKQMPGSPDILTRIIHSFLRSCPGLLEALRAAVRSGDPEAVRRAAHTMKSSNGQIGARQLAAMCHELEILGSQGQLSDSEQRLDALEKEYRCVEKELGLLVSNPGEMNSSADAPPRHALKEGAPFDKPPGGPQTEPPRVPPHHDKL
jgi:CheY-like chemotaxis protein/HPt (histidine-containing phosphotransfer) domain-containing protein